MFLCFFDENVLNDVLDDYYTAHGMSFDGLLPLLGRNQPDALKKYTPLFADDAEMR